MTGGTLVDRGQGFPLVLIPGIQGRWEWMEPAVDALAARHRVVTFSLADEPSSRWGWDATRGFENYVAQVEAALDRCGVDRAVPIGVSYGGLIAAEFAARRAERTAGVAFVSALPVGWVPDARARKYLAAPWLRSPAFVLGAQGRLYPEMRAALPSATASAAFVARYAWRAATAPASPGRMARRMRWALSHGFAGMDAVAAPTLVLTGEDALDRVVPTHETRRYLAVPGARLATLPRTGHIGLVTRPGAFARVIEEFVEGDVQATETPRQGGCASHWRGQIDE
ncbi:MAG: alpha/beta fold hydrolase [Vicinamibacterales bacterium]